jgi:hypothetical protein
MHDGTMHDGTMHDGTMHDGTMHDGTMHDGTMHGGTMHGGTMHGDLRRNAALHREYTIVVRLADGSYHQACIQITSDIMDATNLDAIHKADIEDVACSVNAQLATLQSTYLDVSTTHIQLRDRSFGDATPVRCYSAHENDDIRPFEIQIALLEHYKLQLDNAHVQPCTLDILRTVDAFRATTSDFPEMLAFLRQLRYLMQTYGDASGDGR